MRIINDHDWVELGSKFQSATPFSSICIDNFLEKEFADSLAASYPNYSQAAELGREFYSVNEKLKVQITSPSNFPEPVAELCQTLGSEEFLQNLSIVTGIEGLSWDPSFKGGGMHLTGPSGLLDVHVDFNYEKQLGLFRRLNILIYLNPVWDEAWGGSVELWNKDVSVCEHSFAPIHNRCVLFATSDFSFHGVTALTCPQGVTRNSLAAYYYTDEAGDNAGQVWGGNHTTIFKARPDEKYKKYIAMPLHDLREGCVKNTRKLKSAIKKIF